MISQSYDGWNIATNEYDAMTQIVQKKRYMKSDDRPKIFGLGRD